MDKEKTSNMFEVLTAKGDLLFIIKAKDLDVGKPSQGDSQPKQNGGDGTDNGDSSMTIPQKRFLFRLLADQGIEDNEAYKHLKTIFKVSNLTEVSKADASREIEKLLSGQKGGEKNVH